MELIEYERVKFELAEILRDAATRAREQRLGGQAPFSDLFARLAEDRFNFVVVGRFSRGKTTLMNAMLDTDRLPTGIVPLTSVITIVRYGTSERVLIEHQGSKAFLRRRGTAMFATHTRTSSAWRSQSSAAPSRIRTRGSGSLDCACRICGS